ncbi:unnamed protein product [Chrysodeixis includens]|uniref:Uncharacterized protein n=1 Tax=Chrysodeixis includens TaxID=689277 RepID=A0A9N8KX33_CHRIL|nr:unnamed protein product [Chrysodeixis includens]
MPAMSAVHLSMLIVVYITVSLHNTMLPFNPLHERTFLIESFIHQFAPIVWLKKADAVASSESILRSNTAIQVITGGPRHRFHCDAAQTHREGQGADNTHAFRVRMQSASRSPLTSVRKPAKSEFPEYLCEVSVVVAQAPRTAYTTRRQARTRATAARRGAGPTDDARRLS